MEKDQQFINASITLKINLTRMADQYKAPVIIRAQNRLSNDMSTRSTLGDGAFLTWPSRVSRSQQVPF